MGITTRLFHCSPPDHRLIPELGRTMKLFAIAALLTVAAALPAKREALETKPVAILRSATTANEDGSYSFDFASEDGIERSESGAQKQIDPQDPERRHGDARQLLVSVRRWYRHPCRLDRRRERLPAVRCSPACGTAHARPRRQDVGRSARRRTPLKNSPNSASVPLFSLLLVHYVAYGMACNTRTTKRKK